MSAGWNGGSTCAAAEASPGMRPVLRGQRMVNTGWVETTNRESSAADIGIQAAGEAITGRR